MFATYEEYVTTSIKRVDRRTLKGCMADVAYVDTSRDSGIVSLQSLRWLPYIAS